MVLEAKSKGSFKGNELLQFDFTKTLDQNATQELVFSYFKTNYIKEYNRIIQIPKREERGHHGLWSDRGRKNSHCNRVRHMDR